MGITNTVAAAFEQDSRTPQEKLEAAAKALEQASKELASALRDGILNPADIQDQAIAISSGADLDRVFRRPR